MRLRTRLVAYFIILFCSAAIGQSTVVDSLELDYYKRKLHYLYLDPTAIINPNFGIQIGYERNLVGELSVVVEATYLATLLTDMSGYKFMITPRYYLTERIFVGIEGVHKKISADRESFFDLGTHFQRLPYKSTITANYTAVQFGTLFNSLDQRVFIEIAMSIGAGRRQIVHTGTLGFDLLEAPIFGVGWIPGDERLPYANFAVKFKFCLNRL